MAATNQMHSWEGNSDMSWQGLREDHLGHLQDTSNTSYRAVRSSTGAVQRGMLRYLYLIIDLSKSMQMNDFPPNRTTIVKKFLIQFIGEFLAENPISQLGIIVLRNGRAENISDLSGSKTAHNKALDSLSTPGGDASLQNALDMACNLMRDIPEYGHREVLFVSGTLASKDPGDIFSSIEKVRRLNIHISVISLLVEVYILKVMTEKTGGTFVVATCAEHLKRSLADVLQPPSTSLDLGSVTCEMIEMGFPTREKLYSKSIPMIGYDGSGLVNLECGYKCPRCDTHLAEVPTICYVCGLTLITAPHLAHSYHHLFPLPPFGPINSLSQVTCPASSCYGCDSLIPTTGPDVFICGGCRQSFCGDCEQFLHENLHNCPGCL